VIFDSPRNNLSSRFWVFVLWLCFVLRGVFYCSVIPLWDGFDEWAHFAVAQHMSVTGEAIVDRSLRISKEIYTSLQLAPLPRGMTVMVPAAVTREGYRQLPVDERRRREHALREIPSDWAKESAAGDMPAYEASQPPLYYWIVALILRPAQHISLLERVWIARVVTFLMGSLALPIGFVLTRKLFGNEFLASAITAFVALMPELAIDLARVSNEGLSILLYTCLLLAVCNWVERPESIVRASVIGIWLGLGLLTKAYFLTAVPALLVIYLCSRNNHKPHRRRVRAAAVTLIISLTIAGWWYVRNLAQTATISGLDEALMVRSLSLGEKLRGIFHVKWVNAMATVILSHVWYGGWNLLALPRPVYYASFVLIIAGFCGLLKARRIFEDAKLFSLLSIYAWFWLGQAHQILMLYLSKSSSTALGGWYLYSVIWAEVILGLTGLFALVPLRLRSSVLSFLIVAIAALDIYALHFIFIPYYAGGNVDIQITELLINKPAFLTPHVLLILWTLFLTSTGLAVFAGTLRLFPPRRVKHIWTTPCT
jgi:4-amino-4-deoxy-L-arabinose transferase-like glycosyltransferase